jgi:hypothetical protein
MPTPVEIYLRQFLKGMKVPPPPSELLGASHGFSRFVSSGYLYPHKIP